VSEVEFLPAWYRRKRRRRVRLLALAYLVAMLAVGCALSQLWS
jgi:hypothetical protein